MMSSDIDSHEFKFLTEVLSGDAEKITQIANMTVDSIEKDLKGSHEAFKTKDIDKAHNHLHKMKSNLAHLDLREISSKIPDHKKDDFWNVLPGYLDEVQGNITRVKAFI